MGSSAMEATASGASSATATAASATWVSGSQPVDSAPASASGMASAVVAGSLVPADPDSGSPQLSEAGSVTGSACASTVVDADQSVAARSSVSKEGGSGRVSAIAAKRVGSS